ncbi:CRP-like cAMP-binding protein [Pedobacter sp. AK013]|uniref:Crp/Fnr family transcriptional regulator n=1 Tax=Pedobacter sp. AK013 TaxID=2723071 RepID=UPI001611A165|nr:Crp/Fnr family transcriptional regulator [Pedobacter sp. AK013]MBB6236473.1 CRP-like cAMP-binding protein [Pedobacter sp. AK013]
MNPQYSYNTQEKWLPFNGFSPVITVYKSFHNLTPEMESIINNQTFPVTFKKNKFILSPLHHDKYVYLILNGVVRGYMKDDDKEITIWIAKENELVGSVSNIWNNNESINEYVQALEDVVAIAIPHTMSKQLYLNYHIADYIGRKVTQLHYLQACERALISRLQSAEKRYIRFIKSYPELVDRIPLKYIASFLCMRLETLSRVRSKLALV